MKRAVKDSRFAPQTSTQFRRTVERRVWVQSNVCAGAERLLAEKRQLAVRETLQVVDCANERIKLIDGPTLLLQVPTLYFN